MQPSGLLAPQVHPSEGSCQRLDFPFWGLGWGGRRNWPKAGVNQCPASLSWVGPSGGGVQHSWSYCQQAWPPPPLPHPRRPGGTTHRAMKGDSVPGGSAGEGWGPELLCSHSLGYLRSLVPPGGGASRGSRYMCQRWPLAWPGLFVRAAPAPAATSPSKAGLTSSGGKGCTKEPLGTPCCSRRPSFPEPCQLSLCPPLSPLRLQGSPGLLGACLCEGQRSQPVSPSVCGDTV